MKQKIQLYWLCDVANHIIDCDGNPASCEVGVLYDNGEWWGLHNMGSEFINGIDQQNFLRSLMTQQEGVHRNITWRRAPYPYANMTTEQCFSLITGVDLKSITK